MRFLQGRRLNAFNNQLGDTIVLLSNALRSGYSLLQSMETASRELSQPMAGELQRVTREVGLGLTIQDALANMMRRMPSDDLDLLITAINVQHEVGGNLAEILDTIAHTIRERIRIVGEIRTITAQQRLSGIHPGGLACRTGVCHVSFEPGIYFADVAGHLRTHDARDRWYHDCDGLFRHSTDNQYRGVRSHMPLDLSRCRRCGLAILFAFIGLATLQESTRSR